MNRQRRGLYVDVGAFDPILHSNTYLLHLHGWRGINIDASPSRLARFTQARPHDINIVAAVSDKEEKMIFLEYPTPGTSRLVPEGESEIRNAAGESPREVIPIKTRSIAQVLSEQISDETSIDFLNIDCEGIDYKVLHGWNWRQVRPLVIAVEGNTALERLKLEEYLKDKGYYLIANCVVTLIFAQTDTCGGFGEVPNSTAN